VSNSLFLVYNHIEEFILNQRQLSRKHEPINGWHHLDRNSCGIRIVVPHNVQLSNFAQDIRNTGLFEPYHELTVFLYQHVRYDLFNFLASQEYLLLTNRKEFLHSDIGVKNASYSLVLARYKAYHTR
jgi:hypothetical protein